MATPKATGSLRDRIFAKDDIIKEKVEVEEWGVTVEVRSMTGRERAQSMKEYVDEEGNVDAERLYPALIVATVYDPTTGEPVFQPEDAASLNLKNSGALEKLAQVAIRLSGMGQKAVDEAGKGSS